MRRIVHKTISTSAVRCLLLLLLAAACLELGTAQVVYNPGGSGGSGSGTVTSVSVATANGFSGTVANPTTTPAITIVAGAITPLSVTCGTLNTTSCVITGYGSTSGSATITWPAVAGTATNPIVFSNTVSAPSVIAGSPSAAAIAALPSGAHGYACDESSTAGVPASAVDYIRCDSTTHSILFSFNDGSEVAAATTASSITGSAASLSVSGQTGLLSMTGITSTNRIKTVRDAADTILELGGSYTPTGTWTSMTIAGGALSGTFTGNPTLSGNPAFTGTPTFSNALALGSSTATKQTAGDNSTKVATTSYVATALTGNSTEGTDGFWNNGFPPTPVGILSTGMATGVPTLGTGYVTIFVPSHNYVIGHAGFYTSTTQASDVLYACIYTGTASAAVWAGSANITGSGSNTIAVASGSVQYTLQTGTTYYLLVGQYGSVSGATLQAWTAQNTNALTMLSGQGTYFANSANGLSGAACPSTTGTLTSITSSVSVFPVVLFGP